MNKKRLILVGCAASGKDYARKILNESGYTYQPGYTTRPARSGEVHGHDYFFISEDEFAKMSVEGAWYESVSFNGWHYGTTKEQFEIEGSVFIMTPSGLSHLDVKDRDESLVIYFNIQEELRRTRLISRNDNADKIERRLKADREDFDGFNNFDILVVNPIFNVHNLVEEISNLV